MNWFYNGSNMKSLGELDRLVNDMILAVDFPTDNLHGFRAAHEAECPDKWKDDPSFSFSAEDGWIETSVNISVPADQVKQIESDAPQYSVP
jgi:hypothetical protein